MRHRPSIAQLAAAIGEDATLEDAIVLEARTEQTPAPFETTMGLGYPAPHHRRQRTRLGKIRRAQAGCGVVLTKFTAAFAQNPTN